MDSGRRGGSLAFLDKALVHLAALLRTVYIQWDLAGRDGLLQRADPRLKVLLLLVLVVLVSFKQSLLGQAAVGLLLFLLALFSRIPLGALYGKLLVLTGIFGILVPFPASLNLITPGEVMLPLLRLEAPKEVLWFGIPETVGITKDGLLGMGLMASRIMNSLSATFLVLHTTPMADLVRSLKHFRLPDTMVVVVLLTYRYIFVLVSMVEQIHRARAARLVTGTSRSETRMWAAQRMAFLFQRTQIRCEEMYRAMQCRGFSGRLHVEGFGKLGSGDWVGLVALAAVSAALGFI